MINNLIKKEEYTKKIVIIIDILGIKEFSMNSDNEERLLEYYSLIRNLEEGMANIMMQPVTFDSERDKPGSSAKYKYTRELKKIEDLDYNFGILSDAFVLTFNYKHLVFLPDIMRIARVIYLLTLAKLKLLCKGAISIGKVFHKENTQVLFGEGLCSAAAMESKETLPRIVIDSKVSTRVEKLIYNEHKLDDLVSEYKDIGAIQEGGNFNLASQNLAATFERFFVPDNDKKIVMNVFDDIDYTLSQLNDILYGNTTRSVLLSQFREIIFGFEKSVKKGGVDVEREKRKLERWKYVLEKLELAKLADYPIK